MEDTIVSLIDIFGLPIILTVTLLNGLIIGKPVPTMTFVVTYLLISNITTLTSILTITFLTALFSTIGGTILYITINNKTSKINKLFSKGIFNKIITIQQQKQQHPRFKKVRSTFNNNIGFALFAANIITGLRHLMTIPAAKHQYPIQKFIPITIVSTFLYHSTIAIIIVFSIEGIAELIL